MASPPCRRARAPNDAQFARLRHSRTEIHTLQVCPVHGVDPLNLVVWVCVYSLKLCTVPKPEKVRVFFVSFTTEIETSTNSQSVD